MAKTLKSYHTFLASLFVLAAAFFLFDRRPEPAANELFMETSHITADIEGTVRNEDGTLLPEVHVLIKGTQRSARTDAAGRFLISVNAGEEATLVFSLTGYQSQEIHLGTKTSLDVMLKAESGQAR
ncbi:MAG: hypothetical protein BGO21_20210 [Dyadobacter sp. 50-39]|uniref:carboxypeptidase-like regulatory domain-containing protein n=1 Tax=Dyadobacter sp. 50-39 TaxID=1895756 RepID=UPI0009605456|nr:carboxypeptidase-like regulatory domain-containing protein [Dyadobacter sp. 50-39]OJV13937.1 MAG: hypothetical protein BGO21_20210 [Dyadobacter sp. 50-39]